VEPLACTTGSKSASAVVETVGSALILVSDMGYLSIAAARRCGSSDPKRGAIWVLGRRWISKQQQLAALFE
jgi:hypothetical protein